MTHDQNLFIYICEMCFHDFTFFTQTHHGFEYFTTKCEAERERKKVHLKIIQVGAFDFGSLDEIDVNLMVLTNFSTLSSERPCVEYEKTNDDQEKDVPPPSGTNIY